MPAALTFGEILDSAHELPLDEQTQLAATLAHRVAEARRQATVEHHREPNAVRRRVLPNRLANPAADAARLNANPAADAARLNAARLNVARAAGQFAGERA